MDRYTTVGTLVAELRPDAPLHIFRPQAAERAVSFFLNRFKGDVLYAVKTNPEPHVLKHIYTLGVRNFDVASLAEVRLARSLFPDARLYFMHTVKSRTAIRAAYFEFGVRDFSLDTVDELHKILDETENAKDLNLFIRLAIPNTYAELNLSDKFGIKITNAHKLLREARAHARELGVCFHVGSQCMHPDAYRIAIRMAKKVIEKAAVTVDILDVGGGFPSIYPGMMPPSMQSFFDAIHEEHKSAMPHAKLIAEPGRALVAESGSVIVKVELRKKEHLYINDGTYGSLFDAGIPHFIFPVKMIRAGGQEHLGNVLPFSFFGPTCDTLDFMKGPFYLPEDISEGDYIEIGQLGAYGRTLATQFNGFMPLEKTVIVEDEPLMTVYQQEHVSSEPLEIIAA